ARAASTSKDFPNLECGAASNIPLATPGSVSVKLKWKNGLGVGTPTQLSGASVYAGCETGDLVAANATLALCNSCLGLAGSCTVSGLVESNACANAACCAALARGVAAALNLAAGNGTIAVQKTATINVIGN